MFGPKNDHSEAVLANKVISDFEHMKKQENNSPKVKLVPP
jgi:hypothetical protein